MVGGTLRGWPTVWLTCFFIFCRQLSQAHTIRHAQPHNHGRWEIEIFLVSPSVLIGWESMNRVLNKAMDGAFG